MTKTTYLCFMKLKTKTNNLTKKQIKNIVDNTISWCVLNLGVNNRRKYRFQISLKKQTKGELKYGEFCCISNKITIFYNNCENIKDVITTVIHEYTHYLQPVRTYYSVLYKTYSYYNHPMEVEARKNEKKYFRKVWKYYKSVL